MSSFDPAAPDVRSTRATRFVRQSQTSLHHVVQNELMRAMAGSVPDDEPRTLSLSDVFEQMPVATLVVAAPSGRIVAQNRRARELWQGAMPEVDSIRDYATRYRATRVDGSQYTAEDFPLARSVRRGETVVEEEMEFRVGPGHTRVLLVSSTPVYDAAGVLRWAVATATDVAERRLDERRRDFLVRLASSLRTISQPAEIMRAAASALGEHLGVSSSAVAEVDADFRQLHVHAEYRNGVVCVSGTHELSDFGDPLVAELKAGRVVAIEDVATHPLVDDAALEAFTALEARSVLITRTVHAAGPIGFLLVMHVAPRRWTRDEVSTAMQVGDRAWSAYNEARRNTTLRMSEQWLRYALKAGAAAAWEWDLASDCLDWSEEHHEVLGTDPSQPIRTTEQFLRLVHADDRDRARRGIARIAEVAEATEVGMECRIVRNDGGTCWIRVQGRVLLDGQQRPSRAYGVMLDVTARKSAELEREALLRKLRAADEAKSNFISVMSHEFRTPLTSVIGYSELLSSGSTGELNERQQEQLSRIKASAWHLTQIIDEVLTFSRVEADQEKVHPALTDVVAVAQEAVAIVEPAARERGLAVECEWPDELLLHTDSGKLRQILVNLLANAAKFTDEGGVALRIQPSDDRVLFVVSDTGIGIAEEHLERVFERFWQVNQGSSRSHGGTGLGLTVTRRLAELLGGAVRAESRLGEGSSFTVELPR